MSKRVQCVADEAIAFGARVLVRGRRACIAPDSIANATVVPRPAWSQSGDAIQRGEHFTAMMDDGIGNRDLKALANAPIMDAANIYLPAGKISMEEFKARQRSIILDDRP